MKNAVTAPAIEAKIAGEEFLNPALSPHLTLCALKLQNGFVVIGQSAPADPANFDAGLGRQLARADAIRQIWPLEGYLLREQLFWG
ncbi:Gp49 family protein [Paracoccus sp. (in: a-proteobacteria)]|uniref:Gp49 family protein n=1 Tax=Paracoccus sp. TaxID=267 RepID=UPI00322081F3